MLMDGSCRCSKNEKGTLEAHREAELSGAEHWQDAQERLDAGRTDSILWQTLNRKSNSPLFYLQNIYNKIRNFFP